MKPHSNNKKNGARNSRTTIMDNVKMAICIGLGILLIGLSSLKAQETDSARIHLTGKATQGEVWLRWTVSTPELWLKTLESGWVLERYDFDTLQMSLAKRKKSAYSPNKKTVRISPFLPCDTAQLAKAAQNDSYLAVLGEAVFNPAPLLLMNGANLSSWGKISQEMEAKQMRFLFANLAYDHSFAAACFGKTGYVDKEVKSGHYYLYRLYPDADSLANQDTALYFTRMEAGMMIPPTQEIKTDFAHRTVNLEWDYRFAQKQSVGYFVERCVEKSGTKKNKTREYVRLHQTPLGVLQDNDLKKMSYRDSLPDEENRYAYRVLGVDLFGQEFLVAQSRFGKSKGAPLAVATIDSVRMNDQENLCVHWSYPEENLAAVKSFSLYLSGVPDIEESTSVLIASALSPQTRSYALTPDRLGVSSYFYLKTIDHSGNSTLSRPFFYWKKDSVPPLPPRGLSYSVDSAGVVRLQWKASMDADVEGYRVFCQNGKDAEPVQLTTCNLRDSAFYDTISLNTRQYFYYSVRAVDISGNISKPSELIAVKNLLPDKPAPAVFSRQSRLEENKVHLVWYNSTSSNVRGHALFYQCDSSSWIFVKDFPLKENENIPETSSYVFKLPERLYSTRFRFKLVAYGNNRQSDTAHSPFSYQVVYSPLLKPATPFAIVDAENRYVQLQWKYKNGKPIKRVYVFRRSENEKLRLLATLSPEQAKDGFYTDVSVKMNTDYDYLTQFEYADGLWSAYSEPCRVNY